MLKLLSGNQKGMSLVEVTVAAAISVVIAMGVMKINETGQMGMRSIQDKSEVMNFTNALRGHLLNGDKCLASGFVGHDWSTGATSDGLVPPSDPTQTTYALNAMGATFTVSTGTGTTSITNGANLPWSQGWTVLSYRFYKSENDICNIMIEVEKKSSKSFGGNTKNLWYPLSCSLSTGTIQSCASQNTVAAGYFQDNSAGATGSGIIASNLPAIVGTDPGSVGSHLHVGGNASKTWDAVDITKFHAISTPTNYVISFGASDSMGMYSDGTHLIVAGAGNIGIKKTAPISALEVAGDISTKGGSLIVQRPVTAGGWARGMMFTPDGSINATTDALAGIGVLGSGTTQSRIYLTHGISPWTSTAGIHILPNGNVGVGTTTPGSKLEVNGNTAVTGNMAATATVSGATVNSSGSVTAATSLNGATLAISGNGNVSGDLTVGSTLSTPVVVATNVLHTPTAWANNYFYYSDRRYKKRIDRIKNASDRLSELTGVTYFMRRDEFPEMKFRKGRHIGLIAQDVEKVFPELVVTNPNTGKKAVQYGSFVAILIESFKEQQHEIDTNNKKLLVSIKAINEIIEKTNDQEKRISKLEEDNRNLKVQLRAISLRLSKLESGKD
jgi:Tfp pilus assembly protein PilV